jgi:hypothetical protein
LLLLLSSLAGASHGVPARTMRAMASASTARPWHKDNIRTMYTEQTQRSHQIMRLALQAATDINVFTHKCPLFFKTCCGAFLDMQAMTRKGYQGSALFQAHLCHKPVSKAGLANSTHPAKHGPGRSCRTMRQAATGRSA